MARLHHPRQAGFTLLEALAAFAIITTVIVAYLGIRTSALIDASQARNWRLAKELAEEKLSELQAGAREVPPKSGEATPFEHYPGFRYAILIGESAVNQVESEIASAESENTKDRGAATDRAAWQQNKELYRKASQNGLSYQEYEDKMRQDEEERQRQEKPATESDFVEVAIVVYFPRVPADNRSEDAFVIKAKVSSLALSGQTPDQAKAVAESKGQTITNANAPPGAGGSSSSGASGAAGAAGTGAATPTGNVDARAGAARPAAGGAAPIGATRGGK